MTPRLAMTGIRARATPPVPPSSYPVPRGTPTFPARLAGTDWTYIPSTREVVALMFDAGANDDAVASILAALQGAHVSATFFLTGSFVSRFAAIARRIAAAGFRIGDHTITHPYLTPAE
jgi:peptidoglycan/xylan/chitin deacetylase (PgdA/CDA1 family)